MDRDPLEEQVLRRMDRHCPELTLDEAHVPHDKVVVFRMTRLIGRPAMLLAPLARSYLQHWRVTVSLLSFVYWNGDAMPTRFGHSR